MTKLCKDCADCRPFKLQLIPGWTIARDYNIARCASDNPDRERDPVDGHPEFQFCSILRFQGSHRCGPAAAWFIPK